ncbi:Cytochrome c oxidase subunit 1 [Frankliniella fusca]|uniref:Cytochrome c oxidase subunit 1 n=1 Tax=Frankliniella fusca TaxID=407009 RepID=A0AAE1LHQ8_9NEOP|nr:Cytochrome c oxidase subunit 1 [Frankliniella fusca]
MAGFTAFRQKKLVQGCTECLDSITKPRSDTGPKDGFTLTKESFSGYTFASDELVNLVEAVEKAVGDCMTNHKFHADLVFTTLKYLVIKSDCFVGCLNHRDIVTKKLIRYYLVVRQFFASDIGNQQMGKDKKIKALRKQSKV